MNLWRFLLSVVLISIFIYPVVEGLDIAATDLEKALSGKDDSHKKPLLDLLSTALKKTKKADESKIDVEDKPRRDRKLHPVLDKLSKPKQESENKSNKNRASSNVHAKTGQSFKELTRQMVEKVLLEEKLKDLKEKFHKLKKKYRKLRQRRKHEGSDGKHGLRKKIDYIIGILDQHHVTKKDRKLKHKLQKQIKHKKKARAEAKQEDKKKKPKAKAKKLAKKIKQEKKAQPEPKGKNSGRNVGEKIREAIKALVKPNEISKTQMEKLENELKKVKQNNRKETAKKPQHKHMGKKKIVKEEKKLKNQLVKDDNKLKKKLRDDKRKAKAEKKKVKAKNKEIKAENKEVKAEQKKVKAEKKKVKAEKKKVKAGKKKVKAEKKKIKAGKKKVKAKKQNEKPFIKIIQPNKNAKQGQPAAKLTKIREGQYPQK